MITVFARALAFAALLSLASSVATSIASAQPGGSGTAFVDSETGERYVSAEGLDDEIPGGPYLIAGYGVLFVVLMGYLVSLARRQAAVAREYAAFSRRIEDIEDQIAELEGDAR